MLETGVGRAALIALASLPGFTMTGDLSASDRYFEHDVTEPFELDDGRLAVPAGPGLGRRAAPGAARPLHDRAGAPHRLSRATVHSADAVEPGGGSRSHGRTITIESSGWSGSRRSTIGSVNGGSPE